MGGSSNLEADYDDGTFKMTGNVVKKDGGFVRLAHRPEEISKNAKGIKFKARGNNETYEVHLTLKGVKMHFHTFERKMNFISFIIASGFEFNTLCIFTDFFWSVCQSDETTIFFDNISSHLESSIIIICF